MLNYDQSVLPTIALFVLLAGYYLLKFDSVNLGLTYLAENCERNKLHDGRTSA
jgi:hypothetical protein